MRSFAKEDLVVSFLVAYSPRNQTPFMHENIQLFNYLVRRNRSANDCRERAPGEHCPNSTAQQERERPAAEREQRQRGEELAAAGGRRHRQGRRQAGLLRGGQPRRQR